MTEPAAEPLMALQGVDLAYPDGRVALARIDLEIHAGERLVLLGTNGSGKSTLLKLLDALVLPTRGTYHFDGRPVAAALSRDAEWNRQFRRRVVLMFQQPEAMLFNPTVAEEIGYGLRHLPTHEREARIEDWARRMRLLDHLRTPPFELSGGEKQRLCLACLLAIEPEVLLLDEPTANLDPRTAGWLLDWLAEREITSIIATHQLALAAELGRRLIILSERHSVAFDGPVETGLGDIGLLLAHGLAHAHRHHHAGTSHRHPHSHDW
jgi:cobalt/nickel transport system ATP-binding protein